MRPTHARRQGEIGQGGGVSGGGPVVSLRRQGRGLGGSEGQVCAQLTQGRRSEPVAGGGSGGDAAQTL